MGAVSPGDSNQKIMGSFRFGIALLVLTSLVTAKDVFRYDDEETGQSHYMTGDPGSSVEGGWAFTNSDGTFELVYKADEAGFQPEADHMPVPVEDTNEVTEAKNTFYSLVEEHKAKVEAAKAEAVVDARRKRSPIDVFRYEDEETGQSHYMTGEPGKAVEGGWAFTNPEGNYELVYKADEGGFQPQAAHIPVPVEDTNEVTEAKTSFYSLYEEHKAKVEAAIAEDKAEEAVVDARRKREAYGFYKFHPYHAAAKEGEEAKEFKFIPYHGFVPADEMVKGEETLLKSLHPYHKKLTEKRFKLHPYYGFAPIEEEPKEVKEFKFLPYHGFVPADQTVPDEEALLKNLHPYHKKMASKKFKLDPYYGFVPIVEEEAAVSERKKRDATMEKSQDLSLPPPPHPYNFHPFLGLGGAKPDDTENKLYKYVPYYGFVPAEEKANDEDPEAEADDEEKEETLYKYDHLYGFVKADEDVKPMKDQQYKFVPFYGFVPVNEDGEVEETAKNYGNLKYTFHPYYGFLPTPTDGEVETQLYKLDPVVGFYPSEKTEKDSEEMIEEMTEEVTVEPEEGLELEAKRKKREANPQGPTDGLVQYNPLFIYPTFPYPQLTLVPTSTQLAATPGRVATEEKPDEEKKEQKPSIVQVLPANQLLLQPVVGYPTIPVATYPVSHITYPQTMLPENEFPVIPHSEEDDKVGALEF